MQRCIRFVITFTLLCFSTAVLTARISSFNVSVMRNGSRLEFELNRHVQHRVFMLQHPSRAVIDLTGVSSGVPMPRARLAGTAVKRIRSARRGPGHYRLVLDLKRPVKVSVNTVNLRHHQSRMVVTLLDKPEKVVDLLLPNERETPLTAQQRRVVTRQRQKSKPLLDSSPSAPQARADAMALRSPLQPIQFRSRSRSRKVIVVIDPGHGGKDPGATGPRGIHEKNVVLKISKKLYRLMNRQPGFKAFLTRTGDYYLTLRQRLAVARKHKADMFIAIHADAFHRSDAQGASVFALSEKGATSEAARWIAARENASELMGGVNLSDKSNVLRSVLIDLSQNATVRVSLIIGHDIIKSLGQFARLHHTKVEQAAFVVLKSPDIPSLLVETGFISNPYEERRLRSPRYQLRVAKALKSGIVRYFHSHPPRGTWLSTRYPRSIVQRYVVRSGDSLSVVAEKFNTSVKALMSSNRLATSKLHEGQVLRLPRS